MDIPNPDTTDLTPLNVLLPRPKEALASADGSLSVAGMPPGGYALRVRDGKAEISAVDCTGRRHAETTLEQLRRLSGGTPPDCTIRDWPTFPWRGFMHDCGRNFLDLQTIREVLDLMAKYKLNLFHWHLTDYWGWRLESKRHPLLQAPWAFGRQRGKFYTQTQFREIVDYAKACGVTVMPELDVPGHSLAFRRGLGIKFMCEEKAREIVIDLIDELCSLATPEEMPFIHLGSDEARSPFEMVPDSFCPAWAEAVWRHGRTPVAWCPGKPMTTADGRRPVKMLWHADERVEPGEMAFDTAYWYFYKHDPFSLLNFALFSKPCRWEGPDDGRLGAVIASWHDDNVGDDVRLVARNNNFAAATVMYSDVLWNGRKADRPDLHNRMPAVGTPEFAEAARFEMAVAAQRDKVLADSPLPFAWVRGTDIRWRVTDGETGEVLGENIPQGCVKIGFPSRPAPSKEAELAAFIHGKTGVAVLETWIRSPKDQTAGAWIDFECYARCGGRDSRGTPETGEWSVAKGAKVEVNGVEIPPPEWRHPGLKYAADHPDEPTSNNVSEIPFEDECCWMRPPTPLELKAGWNHVKITSPKTFEGWNYGWQVLFMPVLGTSEHPREVPGLEYRSSCPSPEMER